MFISVSFQVNERYHKGSNYLPWVPFLLFIPKFKRPSSLPMLELFLPKYFFLVSSNTFFLDLFMRGVLLSSKKKGISCFVKTAWKIQDLLLQDRATWPTLYSQWSLLFLCGIWDIWIMWWGGGIFLLVSNGLWLGLLFSFFFLICAHFRGQNCS